MKTMAFPTLALVVLASVRPAVPALAREPGVPWAPAGQLPRAVSQVLDDPQWAAL
jgi:hypothetical protein